MWLHHASQVLGLIETQSLQHHDTNQVLTLVSTWICMVHWSYFKNFDSSSPSYWIVKHWGYHTWIYMLFKIYWIQDEYSRCSTCLLRTKWNLGANTQTFSSALHLKILMKIQKDSRPTFYKKHKSWGYTHWVHLAVHSNKIFQDGLEYVITSIGCLKNSQRFAPKSTQSRVRTIWQGFAIIQDGSTFDSEVLRAQGLLGIETPSIIRKAQGKS